MIRMTAIGHLGKDAIVNDVNGKKVINFSLCHTEKWKDAQGAEQTRSIWVDCSYWTDKTAIAPYLKKGTQVYVEGQPDVRTYTTQDGRNGATLSCKVMSVQLLGGGTGTAQGTQTAGAAPASGGNVASPDMDLPF